MIAGIILLINVIVASASTWLGFRATDVLGNLLLVEIAAFFIVAGILDFSTSVGIAQLRKVLFPGRGGFSTSGRRESERSALVFAERLHSLAPLGYAAAFTEILYSNRVKRFFVLRNFNFAQRLVAQLFERVSHRIRESPKRYIVTSGNRFTI